MDYTKFESWKGAHATEMRDLTYARPHDIFIFTRFSKHLPVFFEGKQVLYAETLPEAIGYIRHIFLYDILNDLTDDFELDFKKSCGDCQTGAVSLLNYWFKLGKIASGGKSLLEAKRFCKALNSEFSNKGDTEYEIQILNGVDELRRFLNKRFSSCENFDKNKLSNICSKDLFAGKPLKDFLDLLF